MMKVANDRGGARMMLAMKSEPLPLKQQPYGTIRIGR